LGSFLQKKIGELKGEKTYEKDPMEEKERKKVHAKGGDSTQNQNSARKSRTTWRLFEKKREKHGKYRPDWGVGGPQPGRKKVGDMTSKRRKAVLQPEIFRRWSASLPHKGLRGTGTFREAANR